MEKSNGAEPGVRGDGHGAFRLIVAAAAICIIFAAIKVTAGFLLPILVAFWILFLCLPITAKLKKLGWPSWAATAAPIVSIVVVVAVIAFFAIAWVANFTNHIPEYQQSLTEQRNDLITWLQDHNISVPADDVDRLISLETIVNAFARILPSAFDVIAGMVFAFLLFAFSMIEAEAAKRRLRYALGDSSDHIDRLRSFIQIVGETMLLRAILGFGAAIGDGILLAILGVPHVGLWVIISFVCSFIPYVGYWIAMVPPLLVAQATIGTSASVTVFFGYWIINGFFDSIIGPKFQGKRLNLSPVVTIISVLFWGGIFGAVGGMIALPLTLGIKLLVLDAFPECRWLSQIIEEDAPKLESASVAVEPLSSPSPTI